MVGARGVVLAVCLGAVLRAQSDFTVSGVVIDGVTQQPLKQVLVELDSMKKGGGSASAITEADGRFVFMHVPRGKYNLQAQRRGRYPQGFQESDGGFATAIVVDGTQKTDNLLFPLRGDGSISGTVLGDDGEPVPNAQVHLYLEAISNGEKQVMERPGTITTSSGHFHFGHLGTGAYYVAAVGAPWYETPEVDIAYPVTFYGDVTNAESARVIKVREGESAEADIHMRSVPSIRVKVPSGSNLWLFVPGPGGTDVPAPGAQTVTVNGQGPENSISEITGLAAGRYYVRSSIYGQPLMPRQVDVANGSALSVDMFDDKATVAGRVIFDGAEPTAASQVFLNWGSGALMKTLSSDGSFKFEHCPNGEFTIQVSTGEVTTVEAKGARMEHERLHVDKGASVGLTIHVQAANILASLDGFAVKDEAGTAQAMVLLVPRDIGRTMRFRRDQSDADGSFTLRGILPGEYTLVAIDDGRNLAYKTEKVIKPYLREGVKVTVPLAGKEPLRVAVQKRKAED